MGENEQDECVGRMVKSRREARQAYWCWQRKLTEWGTSLVPLANAMRAHVTDPEKDHSSFLEAYPTQEELTGAFSEIHRLYQELQQLDETLKNFE